MESDSDDDFLTQSVFDNKRRKTAQERRQETLMQDAMADSDRMLRNEVRFSQIRADYRENDHNDEDLRQKALSASQSRKAYHVGLEEGSELDPDGALGKERRLALLHALDADQHVVSGARNLIIFEKTGKCFFDSYDQALEALQQNVLTGDPMSVSVLNTIQAGIFPEFLDHGILKRLLRKTKMDLSPGWIQWLLAVSASALLGDEHLARLSRGAKTTLLSFNEDILVEVIDYVKCWQPFFTKKKGPNDDNRQRINEIGLANILTILNATFDCRSVDETMVETFSSLVTLLSCIGIDYVARSCKTPLQIALLTRELITKITRIVSIQLNHTQYDRWIQSSAEAIETVLKNLGAGNPGQEDDDDMHAFLPCSAILRLISNNTVCSANFKIAIGAQCLKRCLGHCNMRKEVSNTLSGTGNIQWEHSIGKSTGLYGLALCYTSLITLDLNHKFIMEAPRCRAILECVEELLHASAAFPIDDIVQATHAFSRIDDAYDSISRRISRMATHHHLRRADSNVSKTRTWTRHCMQKYQIANPTVQTRMDQFF